MTDLAPADEQKIISGGKKFGRGGKNQSSRGGSILPCYATVLTSLLTVQMIMISAESMSKECASRYWCSTENNGKELQTVQSSYPVITFMTCLSLFISFKRLYLFLFNVSFLSSMFPFCPVERNRETTHVCYFTRHFPALRWSILRALNYCLNLYTRSKFKRCGRL